LHLKRAPYDRSTPVYVLTQDTLVCEFGELRFDIVDGAVRGFVLNADRVINLEFSKINDQGEKPE
jgi:hypothetical protein